MWPAIYSFFTSLPSRIRGERSNGSRLLTRPDGQPGTPSRIPIVALVIGDGDRQVLTDISAQELWDVHFAKSCEEACDATNRLSAPVAVFDRDCPGAEWRTAVQNLALSPQRTCVILVSGVADEYLCQELIRSGGYDVLAKPLRAGDVARVIKLALSYWRVASVPVAQEPNSWR
ncbi:MAG: hypothetical protein LAP38_03945 [Acidobacteriia bacterium]|nr:hypothetical protein [Terriglobia bacterium]